MTAKTAKTTRSDKQPRPRGRPPGPRFAPGIARSEVLRLRLRPAEAARIREAAAAAQLPVSEWMRDRLLASSQGRIESP